MFNSIIENATGTQLAVNTMISLGVSVLCGIIIALVYKRTERASKSFLVTIATLPAVVMAVILMVNGNIGVGVAVAGSFSLVRFRSLPGKASDILIIFMAMTVGLVTGMGYVVFALVLTVLLTLIYLCSALSGFFNADENYRSIRITIPEDLDFTTVFDDVFAHFTKNHELKAVRTINLGTMYQVTYDCTLQDVKEEKQMIDAIRVRNGNLPVICSNASTAVTEL